MSTHPMTKEEIKAVLREALKRHRTPPTKAEVAEQKLAGREKPTEAMAQDVTLSSNALADRLRDERMAERDRAIAQYSLDRAMEATLRVRQEIVRMPYYRQSATVGPRDSDAHLHQSPQDQLWGKV